MNPRADAWVVDTCVVLDVLEQDAQHGPSSAEQLDRIGAVQGLVICPITAIELAPAFGADQQRQQYFLSQLGIAGDLGWLHHDTITAQVAWTRWRIRRKEDPTLPRRPVSDVLIGAWASRHRGLITRNPQDFRVIFPDLTLLVPGAETATD